MCIMHRFAYYFIVNIIQIWQISVKISSISYLTKFMY